MIPESELMAQARRALREGRTDDAQGVLVNIVISEPTNDEAWLLLAETMRDPQRKLECLERARRIDPHNLATQQAIQSLQDELARAAFNEPTPPAASTDVPPPEPTAPNQAPTPQALIEPLLEYAEALAQAIILSVDPTATRNLGQELVQQLERALAYDEIRVRRWARSAGRAALVKHEKGLTTLITNLPHNDPQLAQLRAQRQQALDLLK